MNRLAGRLAAACALLAACALAPALARADPHTGIGLFGGVAANQGNVELANRDVLGFLSVGLDAGIEYQRVLSPDFSLAGFAQGSLASVRGDAAKSYSTASHGYFGAQIRYWEGAKFVGAQAGVYGEALAAKAGSGLKDTQAGGWGAGFCGGYESDGGWFFVGQLDLAEVAYTNAAHGLTALRLNLGYRWGRT